MSQPTAEEASLMGVPIEIRHMIFEYAAVRDVKPKKVLRYWFEKKEIKEIIAKEAAKNPDGGPMVPASHDEYDSDDDMSPHGNHHEEEDSANEDEDEDEDGDNEDEEDEENEHDEDDEEDDIGNEEEGEGDVLLAVGGQEDAEAENEDIDMPDSDQAEADQDAEEETAATDGDGDGNAANVPPAPPPPPARRIRAHHKWRHVPNFLRMTQCPPPVELFLISKQLNAEAKDWFYKVAILKIDATASFAHMSFFEEVLGKMADASFSPMENIRKAEVTFVWDTTWIRAESTGFASAVFPCFLNDRADYVLKILQKAPELEHVTIHWHDSADDVEAKATMAGTLEPFILGLPGVEIKTDEHYIAADAKPRASSLAGKRRIEFQNIMDSHREAF